MCIYADATCQKEAAVLVCVCVYIYIYIYIYIYMVMILWAYAKNTAVFQSRAGRQNQQGAREVYFPVDVRSRDAQNRLLLAPGCAHCVPQGAAARRVCYPVLVQLR